MSQSPERAPRAKGFAVAYAVIGVLFLASGIFRLGLFADDGSTADAIFGGLMLAVGVGNLALAVGWKRRGMQPKRD